MSDAPREWDADAYHELGTVQVEWGVAVLDRLPLRGDETVLDAGCGSGRLTEHLVARLPRGRVIGVDASEAMLDRAREHLGRYGERVQLRRADLCALGMDAAVDAVFSNAVFHHVPDHDALVASLFAALRPGGRLVAQCGGAGNLDAIRAMVATACADDPRLAALEGWPGAWTFASAADTAARLEAAGFTDVHTRLTPAPVRLGSPQAMRRHLRAITLRSHLARLPDETAREVLLDAVVAQSAANDRPLTLDHVRLDLDAQRRG